MYVTTMNTYRERLRERDLQLLERHVNNGEDGGVELNDVLAGCGV